MALDMKKMKAKYSALQNRGRGGGNKSMWFRPQDGEQVIRIVPTADGDPFKEFWLHYGVGKNPAFLSLKRNYGQDDPIDNFVRALYNEGDEESIKMAKSISAKQRFFSPVLVRGEEDKGVRIWGYGKQVYEQLLNLVLNPEYGDITDVDTGTDLTLQYGKPAGAQFPQTNLTPRRKSSGLANTAEETTELLESIPDIEGSFDKKTFDEMQTILDNFMNVEDDSTGTSQYGGNAIDDALSDLDG
tara:strand:+ start:304 stop:1032 length:729 start_codon:yes stop_codon:yes gene_type:complete